MFLLSDDKEIINIIDLTFITIFSRVFFSNNGSTLGKNCSSLKMESILNASSVVISSRACCPKLWKTSNHLSKRSAITI
ncbi:hypothetical protein Hanom_Chr15g01413821 [Helianthus anomalus]